MRLVSVVTSTRPPLAATSAAFGQQVVHLVFHRADFGDRVDQAGRADDLFGETPPVRSSSHGPGVAETNTVCGRKVSHSSNFSGRLSMQLGRRKPNSARMDLREKSPLIHAADLRHGDMAFIDDQQRVFRQIFEQGRRRLAGVAAGEIAGIILDALAGAGGFHHFDIEGGALLQALGFQQFALGDEFVQPLFQLRFDVARSAWVSVGRGVT